MNWNYICVCMLTLDDDPSHGGPSNYETTEGPMSTGKGNLCHLYE